jgi:putative PIN family toxin of toxin-antitoxin system
MTAVFDTNVFVSAAASATGSSRHCFVLLAKRQFQLIVTKAILDEYEAAAVRLSGQPGRTRNLNWRPLFQWLSRTARLVEASPMGKQRSRDAADDIFLAAALAGGAKFIVLHDRDLLVLKKPFGIEILKPANFVVRFKS